MCMDAFPPLSLIGSSQDKVLRRTLVPTQAVHTLFVLLTCECLELEVVIRIEHGIYAHDRLGLGEATT